MEDAKSIIERWSGMVAARMQWDSEWEQAARYCLPRKGNITTHTNPGPQADAVNQLFDTTAIESASILAAGHASAITPAGTNWFAWEAPQDLKSDEADSWYKDASEKAVTFLSSTNFYTVLNECFEDRSGFGLCCLGSMPHPERKISFQAHPVGSFCCEEDSEGNVDTVFLKKPYTIRQLVQMFGEKVILSKPKLAKAWEEFKAKGTNSSHDVIHAVFPRINRDETKPLDILQMPFASVWVTVDGPYLLLRSGMPEQAYSVSRYLKRTGAGQVYGYSPYEQAKAAIVSANKTQQILQVVAQKMAVPPVLVPDNLVGNVDGRPGGQTVFKTSGGAGGAMPREWMNTANPQGMREELEDHRQAIRNAYHTDLFKMFSGITKQMTAREVAELSAEKLMPFSPSFTRFTADFKSVMDRVFAILFRAGVFGPPESIPQAVRRMTKSGMVEVPPPSVVYLSRVALAIRQAESAAGDRTMERVLQAAQIDPSVADNVDMDAYIRGSARNDGAPETMLVPEDIMKQRREARAEAQAQQQQLADAQAAAQVAKNAGIQLPPQA